MDTDYPPPTVTRIHAHTHTTRYPSRLQLGVMPFRATRRKWSQTSLWYPRRVGVHACARICVCVWLWFRIRVRRVRVRVERPRRTDHLGARGSDLTRTPPRVYVSWLVPPLYLRPSLLLARSLRPTPRPAFDSFSWPTMASARGLFRPFTVLFSFALKS